MRKTLIVFYSFSKNTEQLALEIATLTDGELRELVPAKPYSFEYNTAAKEARGEIARGYCPPLLSGLEPIDAYDTVFIGSPNWFKSIAPPVLSFLRKHDFTDKTVIPFCTHGGGGLGEIEQAIQRECAGATVLEGFASDGIAHEDVLLAWMQRIGHVPANP